MKSCIPSRGVKFFYLFEKVKCFCGRNLLTKEFRHKFQRLLSWLSTSLDLQIPPNLELILGNWQLASYRKMKYLELNLVCVDVVSLTVGKQHDIAHEISERV